MTRSSNTLVDPDVGWKVDHRGYIHGGFDTPIFEKVKQRHNSQLTRTKREKKKIEKSSSYGLHLHVENAINVSPEQMYRQINRTLGSN